MTKIADLEVEDKKARLYFRLREHDAALVTACSENDCYIQFEGQWFEIAACADPTKQKVG